MAAPRLAHNVFFKLTDNSPAKVEEIVAYWPALVDKGVVQTNVEVLA